MEDNIDSITYREHKTDGSNNLFSEVEEFIYGNPELLSADRETYILLNISELFLIPVSLSQQAVDEVVRMAFSVDNSYGDYIFLEGDNLTNDLKCLFKIDARLVRLIERSFQKVKYLSIYDIYNPCYYKLSGVQGEGDKLLLINADDNLVCYYIKDENIITGYIIKDEKNAEFFVFKTIETIFSDEKLSCYWVGEKEAGNVLNQFITSRYGLREAFYEVPKRGFDVYIAEAGWLPDVLRKAIISLH